MGLGFDGNALHFLIGRKCASICGLYGVLWGAFPN